MQLLSHHKSKQNLDFFSNLKTLRVSLKDKEGEGIIYISWKKDIYPTS